MKPIDPIEVKLAIKNGQLKVIVNNGYIFLQDIGGGVEGDTVVIGETGDMVSKSDVLNLIRNTPYDWSNLSQRVEMMNKIRSLKATGRKRGSWLKESDDLWKCSVCSESSCQKR